MREEIAVTTNGQLDDERIVLVMADVNHHHTLAACIAATIVLECHMSKMAADVARLGSEGI